MTVTRKTSVELVAVFRSSWKGHTMFRVQEVGCIRHGLILLAYSSLMIMPTWHDILTWQYLNDIVPWMTNFSEIKFLPVIWSCSIVVTLMNSTTVFGYSVTISLRIIKGIKRNYERNYGGRFTPSPPCPHSGKLKMK